MQQLAAYDSISSSDIGAVHVHRTPSRRHRLYTDSTLYILSCLEADTVVQRGSSRHFCLSSISLNTGPRVEHVCQIHPESCDLD